MEMTHPVVTDDLNDPYSLQEKLVYVYIIPAVGAVGILGNLAVLALLVASTKREAGEKAAGAKKRFTGFMYEYIKGIAILDTLYLVFSLQTAYMVSAGITQEVTDPTRVNASSFDPFSANLNALATRASAVYWWNVFSPLWNAWSGASDLVLAAMTVERYLVMRAIDQPDAAARLTRKAASRRHAGDGARAVGVTWARTGACVLFSLLFHLPFVFQFDVEECGHLYDDLEVSDCYVMVASSFSQTWAFDAISIAYQAVMSAAQWGVVLALNLALMAKLRRIWRRQKQLKQAMSHPSPAPVRARVERVESISTVSYLVLRPPHVSPEVASGVDVHHPRMKQAVDRERSRGPAKSKRSLSLLPAAKLSSREVSLTVLMVAVASFHVLLSAPGNAEYLIWTAFPDAWSDWDGSSTFEAVASLLLCVNYSLNFFLLCAADAEIRRAVNDAYDAAKDAVIHYCCPCCA